MSTPIARSASALLAGALSWGLCATHPVAASDRSCVPCGMRAALGDEATLVRLEDGRGPLEEILAHLDAPEAPARARACLAVGRVLGPLAADRAELHAQRRLAELLRADAEPEVRRAAAFALGLLQTEPAGAALAALLVSGKEPDALARALAAEALGRCDPGRHPAALSRALADPDPEVLEAALLAVWKGPCASHLDRILELSASRDPEIRWRAAYALMRILGAPPAGRTPVPGGAALEADRASAVRGRLLSLAGDADARVRLQALRALGRWPAGDPDHARAVAAASGALSPGDALAVEDARLRVEAARSLGALLAGSERLAPIAPALADPHAHVRVAAIEAAGRVLFLPALCEALAPALCASSPWERAAAVTAVTQSACDARQYDQALHGIARASGDPAWSVRYAAAEGLTALWTALETDAESGIPPALGATLEDLRARFLDDDRRVAKACVADWLARRPQSPEAWAGLVRDAERYLAGDDEIGRALALEGVRAHLSAESARPLEPAEREALLRRLEPLRRDPSGDVRAALAELARCLGDSSGALAAEAAPQRPHRTPADYARALEMARRAEAAVLETAGGEIEVELFGEDAPLTVENFARLSEEGFYDGGLWHRVVPDFVAQDGCPRGDGWGGPPWTIRCEVNAHRYAPGTLGMALSGKDTGGSQFFLTLSDQPHLDGRYTIFGRVTRGMEILLGDGIRQADTTIERVRVRWRD